ncbi:MULTISPECIES: CPBP family intramembrane glutamic endopeptidase [unclassified Clostridium]|jgi:membrane protease YdiL (CAAX protease family)|uniref:CPBP family intramembrane glutamic endopeptidase n=1 Tax=unclassified Clostridium TaxID=2614128 RepID=UPI0011070A7A|nr:MULTISPECIES: CPBP family intramembrane glutamic endopeptidase [unclassified Clostridium]
MRDEKQLLPAGWQKRVLAAAAAALAGNLLVKVIPWPGSLLSSYEEAMSPAVSQGAGFLWMTLVLAPVLEEGAFRLVLYGWLRRFMAFLPSAVISSLAFGIYHGNWIQGTYAFLLGMVLAWGYESSEYRRYPMAVLMHGAANLAALAVFG